MLNIEKTEDGLIEKSVSPLDASFTDIIKCAHSLTNLLEENGCIVKRVNIQNETWIDFSVIPDYPKR